jgi:hypothetical protein
LRHEVSHLVDAADVFGDVSLLHWWLVEVSELVNISIKQLLVVLAVSVILCL